MYEIFLLVYKHRGGVETRVFSRDTREEAEFVFKTIKEALREFDNVGWKLARLYEEE